ncbi:MAG TPA: hypothetical protein DET40_10915 [Lentisphaeria bacterium]|nr:MAG: hypothetical protein A2X45_11420 [Lentisphaerae bacterium GWF2_50_93]HCE44048.1 hypothetical protein [Lentisphaeria bacterium]
MQKVTLQHIAEKAGICKATVSYVLNGVYKNKRISEKTAKKILRIAKNMDYRFDEVARGMSNGRTNSIGFISACDIRQEYISGVLMGAMDKADELHLSIKLLHYRGRKKEEILSECRSQRLSGLMCYDFERELTGFLHKNLAEDGIPLVVVSNTEAPAGTFHVMADDRQGAGLAVEHLHRLGHARIAFMSSDYSRLYEKDRLTGYLDKLKELGLKTSPDYIVSTNEKSVRIEFINRICSMKNGPTAMICTSDATAISMISYLQGAGRKVPGNMSIVGYGDLSAGRVMIPALTTIVEPYSQIGAKAVEMIHEYLSKQTPSTCKELLSVKLLARESTCRIGHQDMAHIQRHPTG